MGFLSDCEVRQVLIMTGFEDPLGYARRTGGPCWHQVWGGTLLAPSCPL